MGWDIEEEYYSYLRNIESKSVIKRIIRMINESSLCLEDYFKIQNALDSKAQPLLKLKSLSASAGSYQITDEMVNNYLSDFDSHFGNITGHGEAIELEFIKKDEMDIK